MKRHADGQERYIKELETRIRELEARLAEAEGFRASHGTCCLEPIYRQERDQARRDLDRKDHECASLKASIRELETRLSVVRRQRDDSALRARAEMNDVQARNKELEAERARVKEHPPDWTCDDAADFQQERDEAKARIRELESRLEKVKALCEREIASDYRPPWTGATVRAADVLRAADEKP